MAARFRIRGERLLLLALAGLLLLLSLIYLVVRKAEEFTPRYFTNTVLLSVLGLVNAILVLALLFVLFRNLIRLAVERRRGTLGSQFKTKLVVIFLGLTLIPSILLFVAAQKLIEHSIKKWFSSPVEEVVRASEGALNATLERYRDQALHFARRVADDVAERRLLAPSRLRYLRPAMEDRLREYDLDLIVVTTGGEAPMTVADPRLPLAALDGLPQDIIERAVGGQPAERVDDLGEGRIVRAAVPVPGTGPSPGPAAAVSVGYTIPEGIAVLTRRIARSAETYRQTKALKTPIQRSYYLVLILVTALVLFAAVAVGMALARRITVPIGLLAEGTREVAAGHLDYQVRVDTDDEFAILVDSFNRMTRALADSNRELAERRRYIETLLENITPGVVSLDGEGRVSTINRSACRILGVSEPEASPGTPARELFARPEHADLAALVQEASHSGISVERSLTLRADGSEVTVSATLTPLADAAGIRLGMIIVLEDVTQLLRAEKVAAWQEVARRLAHEIKNPLTPIQLSAQRIAKKIREGSPDLARTVEEGTSAIVEQVGALKRLVDEFSLFARLPAVRPVPADPHQVIDQAIALYDGLHPGLTFRREFVANGDPVRLDPEQMKRVFINLFENAIEAMEGRGTITVATRRAGQFGRLRIEVSDDGPGVGPEDRDRLFVPYFSTKRRGTGLGLAIVGRIVADHDGTVRMEDNAPRGSRFIIELPARS